MLRRGWRRGLGVNRRLLLVAAAGLITGQCRAQCEEQWTTFPGGGTQSGSVRASILFDEDADGPGAASLFAGGDFFFAGGADANKIARLTGTKWTPLGAGLSNDVNALEVYDNDGPGPNPPALYVGGTFTEAGGAGANRIAMWDGESWSALGEGLNDGVFALKVFDDDAEGPNPPALYVGGVFTTAGGISASRIARWDGSSWSDVSTGTDSNVDAFAVFDNDGEGPEPPSLIVGGSFTAAGGVSANGVARWDGKQWRALGEGLGGDAEDADALAVFDEDGDGPLPPSLFVAGSFNLAGRAFSPGIGRWDGLEWTGVGGGLFNGTADSLWVHDEDSDGPLPPALFVGGGFDNTAEGLELNGVARWDGVEWSALGEGMIFAPRVRTFATFDQDESDGNPPALFAGGSFDFADGLTAENVAFWNGTHWAPNGQGANAGVNVLTAQRDGDDLLPDGLYMGGTFEVVDGALAESVAHFDGFQWQGLAGGVDGSVEALTIFDPDGPDDDAQPLLIVGGGFISVDGDDSMQKIAAWDGLQWLPMGSGMAGGNGTPVVSAIAVWDPDDDGPVQPQLFAGGNFLEADGNTVNSIARWTGSTWTDLADGVNARVWSLAVFDPDGPGRLPSSLFVGGEFTQAGAIEASGVARWDNLGWHDVDGGIDDPGGPHRAFAMSVFDEDGPGGRDLPRLFVGGDFVLAGGLAASNIARWDGSVWSEVGGGANGWVQTMQTFDPDGPGPRTLGLYAGGIFGSVGGMSVNRIARWDGRNWSSLSDGISGGASALAVYDAPDGAPGDMLYVGGPLAADGQSTDNFAGWSAPRPLGDVDGDCAVGSSDLVTLLGAWGRCAECNDCAADLDGDCDVDGVDLILLLGNWQ